MGMSKSERVRQFLFNMVDPMSADHISRITGVSVSTVNRVLRDHASAHHMAYRQKSGNFYRVFFPSDWDRDKCQEWLDKRCKSGKSKATIY